MCVVSVLIGSPVIRLAVLPNARAKTQLTRRNPKLRLALSGYYGVRNPTLRLTPRPKGQDDNVLVVKGGIGKTSDEAPALLCSYYYVSQFIEDQPQYIYRDWALDSGAFSAFNSGVEIDLEEYCRFAKEQKRKDKTLTEVFALDVIGDAMASMKNTEYMQKKGIDVIPTFHASTGNWDIFKNLCRDYPKVAIGGTVGLSRKKKRTFIERAFHLAWPKKIHGFGIASRELVLSFPFHSVDASSWEAGPAMYGRWRSFGGQHLSWRGSNQNLRSEINWYLKLEQEMRFRWRKEMRILENV